MSISVSIPSSSHLLAIYTIIRDALDKMDIVSNLVPVEKSGQDDVVVNTLTERNSLEDEFQAMMKKRETATTVSIKAKQENAAIMKHMMGEFHSLSKRLNAKLSADNANASALYAAKLRKEKLRLINILTRTAEEIKTTSSCPTLFKTVEEEKTRESRYENTLRYVQALTESVSKLEAAIDAERDSRSVDEAAALESLNLLKNELATLKSDVSTNQQFEESESFAQLHTLCRVNASEEAKLAKQLSEIREKSDQERKAFELSSSFLSRKQEKADSELNSLTNKYNNDLKNLTENLERLTGERERMLQELRAAEETLKKELAEKASREEEELRRKNARTAFIGALIRIQCLARRWIARRKVNALRAAKKSNSKKDKKK